MNLETIRLLYRYTDWANGRILDSAAQLSQDQFKRPFNYSIGSIHDQIVHVMSAEYMWFSRLGGVSPKAMLKTADFPTLEAIRAHWETLKAARWAYLDSLDDARLNAEFSYQKTNGEPDQQPVMPILLHVVNHGTDHRAQILSLLDQVGGQTFEQDLIYFLRQS